MNSDKAENEILKEKKILIMYTSGYLGIERLEKKPKYKKGFLHNFLMNHPNFCDKKALELYMQKFLLLDDDFLVTPPSIHNRRIIYKVIEINSISESSNIDFDSLKEIGHLIKENYEDYNAFIIIHGTATMHYTASVLSFMLENLNKPVIFTGSHIPLVEMRNDAQRNLIDALTVAGNFHIPEVCILFDSVLYRGNRTIKNDNMRFAAFESPNFNSLGEIGIKIKINWELILPPPKEEFSFCEVFNMI